MKTMLRERVTLSVFQTPAAFRDAIALFEPFCDMMEVSRREMLDWVYDEKPVVTLYYVDGKPAGVLTLVYYNRSAEVHGVVLPQYWRTDLSDTMSEIAFADAAHAGKPRMTAKVPDGNKGALGWVRRHGFKRSARRDKGFQVYIKQLEPAIQQEVA